jgi:NitT/TauT family transport system ATP-binding protein
MDYKIEKLDKSYGNNIIYENFSIVFHENHITCILGPSGCGKTTLLNIIGALNKAEKGKLTGFEGKRIAYIFQEQRLLTWKTVRQNIELVISDLTSKIEKKQIVDDLLQLVQLSDCSDLYPYQLSGGMSQRVSIARAFAFKPDIILMDEPFKGLDLKLKNELFAQFKNILKTDAKTIIFVTHDPDEAIYFGNDIYVFSKNPVKILGKFSILEFNNKTTLLEQTLLRLLNE